MHESVDRFVGRAEVKLHPIGMQLNLRVAVENLSGNKRGIHQAGDKLPKKVQAWINRLKALQQLDNFRHGLERDRKRSETVWDRLENLRNDPKGLRVLTMAQTFRTVRDGPKKRLA